MAIISLAGERQHADEQQEILSRIDAMRDQERKTYTNFRRYCFLQSSITEKDIPDLQEDLSDEPTDELCRTKMVDWSYAVVDSCGFSRSNVFVAASNLDRYLSTPAGQKALISRREFQLACMTSIYTAVKINEVEALTPQGMARVSRGDYTAGEIEACELDMLLALKWHANPPTPSAYLTDYTALLRSTLQEPSSFKTISSQDQQALIEHIVVNASFQIDLAAREYSFVGINASSIALAAIINTMATTEVEGIIDNSHIKTIADFLCANLSVEIESVLPLCSDLLDLVSPSVGWDNEFSTTSCSTSTSNDERSRDESFGSQTSFDDVTKTSALTASTSKVVSPICVKGPTVVRNKQTILGQLLCGILEPEFFSLLQQDIEE